MSDDFNYVPEAPEAFEQAPEKKSNKTIWIIVAVVAVILLCCCLLVVLSMVFGFVPAFLDEFVFESLPYLAFV